MRSLTVKKSFKGKCKLTYGQVSMFFGYSRGFEPQSLMRMQAARVLSVNHDDFKAECRDLPHACSKKDSNYVITLKQKRYPSRQ